MVSVGQLTSDLGSDVRVIRLPDPSREVSWVATSELPDAAAFFKGGEVVLTTGLQTTGWAHEWTHYVDSLAQARIVAIGIGTGLTYDTPPAGLVAACEHHGMNLFEVPRQTPFVSISHRVSRLLADEDDRDARAALRTLRILTSAAVKPDGATQVLSTLAKSLGGACLVGADGRIAAGPIGEHRDALVPAVLAGEIQALRKRGGRTASAISGPTGTVVLQPLGVSGRRPSYLAVAGPGRLSDGQRSTITAAVALLSLIDEQQRGSAHAFRRLRARAVDLVVTGHPDVAGVVLAVEAGAAGLPERLQIVRANGTGEEVDEILGALEGRRILAAAENDAGLCVLADATDALSVAESIAGAGMRVGVGTPVGIAAADESYRTAGLAMSQAAWAKVVEWDKVFRSGPLGLIDPDAGRVFARSVLGDLDDEQRDLLRCFLLHHGSVFKVAQDLAVHRNTVRNRLAAVEQKLPGSLQDPQVRVSAWIALQVFPAGDAPATNS